MEEVEGNPIDVTSCSFSTFGFPLCVSTGTLSDPSLGGSKNDHLDVLKVES